MILKPLLLPPLFLFFSSSAFAEADSLSRHWHAHLWLWEHSDIEVDVYHLPNGTIRATGRFSNGLQTIDRKYALGIFVENSSDEVWHMIINERVPPTGAGGTQVRWKADDMPVTGEVSNVYIEGKILNDQSGVFGLQIDCEYGQQETKCKWPKPFYEEEKGNLFPTYTAAAEMGKVDICQDFQSQTWNTVEVGYWTECNSRTGVISEHSKVLDKPIPPCPGCAIP